MKRFIPKIFIFFAVVATFAFAKFAFSQTAAPQTSTQDFFVEFTPEYPGANTTVSAQVGSYSLDMGRALIAWLINDKIVGQGKTFSFTTGNLGSQTSLKVSIITSDERVLAKSFFFQAVETDLLWEASTYIPLSYSGKALPTSYSAMKITAVPQGFKTADYNLVYEWRLNDANMETSSGIGKNVFNFASSETGGDSVEVKVSTIDKSITSQNSVFLKLTNPKILFYEDRPLEGLQYQRELGQVFSPLGRELTVRAEPYFFSSRALGKISWEWTMNDKKMENQPKPNVLNLTIPSNAQGASLIGLLASNPFNILERAEKELRINFSN